MPPPAPPPGAPLPGEGPPATAERYNARLSRARSSNRLQMRSASSAKLEIDDTRDVDAPEGQASSSSNDAPGILPPGALRRVPQPKWTKQVADAMEAEIDRADCKEMVRDITHAVLPTRQTVLGMGGRGMPASLAGLELRYQQQQAQDPEEDPVPGEVAAALDQRGFQMKPSSRLANVDEFSSSNEASPKKVARQPARSSQQGAGASGGSPGMGVGISSSRRGGGGSGRAEEQEWDDSLAAASAGYGHADEEEDEDADSNRLAMQAAIAAERADIVEELLRGSAGKPVEPNGVLASGKTYLGLAASAGMYKVAAALLAHGADPNLVDRNGDSPLHVGVRAEHLNVVRLLVDSGAVSGVIDANGTTPLQLAGSDRMRQLLLAAGMGEPLPERGDGDGEEEGSEEEEAADESLSRPSEADGILTNADANARPHGAPPHPKLASGGVSSDSIADLHAASPNVTTVVAASSGPPPIPSQKLGDPAALPSSIVRQALLTELQSLLCSKETNLKRLLMLPSGLRQEVQCDVVRWARATPTGASCASAGRMTVGFASLRRPVPAWASSRTRSTV